jgi:signal peptidase I
MNIVVIVAIVGGIRTFLVSPFQVEGNSMVDTLEDKQYIIINKLAYLLGEPERGDVVVFRPPNDPSKYYVKRVLGIPGDHIEIRGGYVYTQPKSSNEEIRVEEEYLNDRNDGHTYRHPPSSGNTATITYDIPEDHYFLLGDNRQGSLDSRSFTGENNQPTPFVVEGHIKGRVWFVALPMTKIHALEPPEYGF